MEYTTYTDIFGNQWIHHDDEKIGIKDKNHFVCYIKYFKDVNNDERCITFTNFDECYVYTCFVPTNTINKIILVCYINPSTQKIVRLETMLIDGKNIHSFFEAFIRGYMNEFDKYQKTHIIMDEKTNKNEEVTKDELIVNDCNITIKLLLHKLKNEYKLKF